MVLRHHSRHHPRLHLPLRLLPHGDRMRSTDNSRFNLSRWALEHPALTRYLKVVLMVLGMAAYFQLGQDGDCPLNHTEAADEKKRG